MVVGSVKNKLQKAQIMINFALHLSEADGEVGVCGSDDILVSKHFILTISKKKIFA